MDAFYVDVKDLEQAVLILETLAEYDAFEYEMNVKPDYSNVSGLEIWEDGEWLEWSNDDFSDIDEYREFLEDSK